MGTSIHSAHKSGAPVVLQEAPLSPKSLQPQLSFAGPHYENSELFAPVAERIHNTGVNSFGFRQHRRPFLYSPLDGPEKVFCHRFLEGVPATAKATTRPPPAPTLMADDFSDPTATSPCTHRESHIYGLSPRSSISLSTYDSNKLYQSASSHSTSLRSAESRDCVDPPSRLRRQSTYSKLNYLKKLLGKEKRVNESQTVLECTHTTTRSSQAAKAQIAPISNHTSMPSQPRCQTRLTANERKLQAREPTTIDHRKAAYADQLERPDPNNLCAVDSGDVMFSGSIIFSKNLLVDRHDVPSGSRMAPPQASTDPSQESSDEEMEAIIAGLRRIGPPGKALTTPNYSAELKDGPEANRGTPHLCRSRLPIPPSSLYKSSPKFLHRQKSLERALAKKFSSHSLVNPMTSRKRELPVSPCEHQNEPSPSPTPTRSLSCRDLHDSDEEMDYTMANLRSILSPAKEFCTSKPPNESTSTIAPVSRFSSSWNLKSADWAADDDHARQAEELQHKAPDPERLLEGVTGRRSSLGSLLEVDEDEVDEFIMPTWPAMTSTTKSPFDKTPLTSGPYRPDECSISTRLLVQKERRPKGKASNSLRIV